jgi:hypothetical protein
MHEVLHGKPPRDLGQLGIDQSVLGHNHFTRSHAREALFLPTIPSPLLNIEPGMAFQQKFVKKNGYQCSLNGWRGILSSMDIPLNDFRLGVTYYLCAFETYFLRQIN